MIFRPLYLFSLFVVFSSLAAQQNAEALWINGDLNAAIEAYEKQPQSDAEAQLALSFITSQLGDMDASLEAFLRYTGAEQDVARRNAMIDALWPNGASLLTDDQVDLYESLIGSPYSRINTLALYQLSNHYLRVNKFDKATDYMSQTGILSRWSIVGDFENISESGFDRNFGVLSRPEASSAFKNKRGAPVKWFTGLLQRNGWMDFSNHFYMNNSIAYAQTFCKSPSEQEVYFRFGSSGSAKIWLNDQLLFQVSEERDNHFDTHVFKGKLQAGNNRILIQIGNTTNTGANFALRLTDAANRPIAGLDFDRMYQPYKKASGPLSKVIPDPTFAYFKGKIDDGTAEYVDYLSLANLYLTNDFSEELRQLAEQALTVWPENIHLLEILHIALLKTEDETGASAIKQKLIEIAPDSRMSLEDRFQKAKDTEDWDEYARTLATWESIYPDNKELLGYKVGLAASKNDVEQIVAIINEGYERYPTDFDYINAKASIIRDLEKQPKKATAFLQRSFNKYFSRQIAEQLIDTYWQEGNVLKVMGIFDKLKERYPAAPAYYLREAKIHETTKDYRKMDAAMEELLRRAPYIGNYYKEYGGLLERRGDKAEAKKMYEKAIDLNPYDYDSRSTLRALSGSATTAFKNFPEFDYYEAYANAPDADAYPDDHSVVLRYDVAQVIHPGGGNEIRVGILIKVFNDDGIEAWKEYTIGVGSDQDGTVEKVEVLDPDGSRREASRSGADVVFDNLQPGGAIFLQYRLQESKSGRLIGKFWNQHPLTLGYPSVALTYELEVPKGFEFDYVITGLQTEGFEPEIEELGNSTMYRWGNENHPGYQVETSSPQFEELQTMVRVSNIEKWDFIADWYAELTYAKIQPDDIVKQKTEELFAGKTGLSQREEVEIIYEYVAKEIRYISVPFLQSNFIPQRASHTLNTGQGDCKDVSSLFVSMCQLRGIKANLVLVNTRDRSHVDLTLPSIAFNHCIAYLELDGEPYFVELTDDNLPFATGDWSVNNAFGLVIPRDGEGMIRPAGKINPENRGVNKTASKAEISIDGGTMKYSVDYLVTNANASGIRHGFENESQTNREKSIKEWLSGEFPKASLDELSFKDNLYDNSNTVDYRIAFTVEDAANSIGGMDIYELHLYNQYDGAPSFIGLEERKLPLDIWQSFNSEMYQDVSVINPPAGKSLVEVPENVSISNKYVEYKLVYQQDGEKLIVDRTMKLKNDIIPVADYPAFREDFLKIVAADKISLAYR